MPLSLPQNQVTVRLGEPSVPIASLQAVDLTNNLITEKYFIQISRFDSPKEGLTVAENYARQCYTSSSVGTVSCGTCMKKEPQIQVPVEGGNLIYRAGIEGGRRILGGSNTLTPLVNVVDYVRKSIIA
jgi:hypothetical protein